MHSSRHTPRLPVLSVILVTHLLLGCASDRPSSPTPLELSGLGPYRARTSTDSAEAAGWFAQGVTLYWGFNHQEAMTSFERALELDPKLAIAHAYISLSLGPNINDTALDPEKTRVAFEAARRAMDLLENGASATPAERGIIAAALVRCPAPVPPADPAPSHRAYAESLRALHAADPSDIEVACLFAESLLDLRPWDQWQKDGTPNEGTLDAVAAIEHALEIEPLHPGANHLLIHAVEASPHPDRATAAADRLRDLVPGIAHLVHMPSHIDIRRGHYAAAITANQAAIAADEAYAKLRPRGGIYAMYRAHNFHFLIYAALFDGRKALALEAVAGLENALPQELIATLPQVLEGFLATRDHVLVRFGDWDALLARELPADSLPVTLATRRYARGIALSALGRIAEAEVERAEFERIYATLSESAMVGNNPARVVLAIGRSLLEGELEYRKGNFDRAFAALRDAVAKDEALRYDEPWGWMMPARHALGALLLEQGKLEEALAVYRDDLKSHPDNGWALTGMASCLERLGWNDEANDVRQRLNAAFARKDVAVETSCYCARSEQSKTATQR